MAIMKKTVVGILLWESRQIIRKYKPFIVAVTGSVGKTSTKDAIYDVLKHSSAFVRKSEKGFNTEIGLPLTIIGVPNGWYDIGAWLSNIGAGMKLLLGKKKYPQCLILEIGADHPGDIKKVVKWLRPDIAVITRVSRTPVHVEFFKSPEEVFEEKAALATAVKDGGTLIIYGDDDKVLSMGDRVKGRNVSVVSYGVREGNSVRAADVRVTYENNEPKGLSFEIANQSLGGSINVDGIVGETHVYPLLAATAAGRARGLEASEIISALQSYQAPRGRMNLIAGINGSTLIDDSYNSSPDAASAALSTLKSIQTSGRKIAVLGDMMELGKFAGPEHRRIGAEAAATVNVLVTVGQRSRLTAEEALKLGMTAERVKTFDNSKDAAEYMKSLVQAGDLVLIKGSQSVRTERITAALLREPEKAAKLLVRQEKEWLLKP